MKNQSQTLFQRDLVNEAIKQSFVKLNPKIMFKNPVMFLVEIGTIVMFIVSMFSLTGDQSQGSFSYNFLLEIAKKCRKNKKNNKTGQLTTEPILLLQAYFSFWVEVSLRINPPSLKPSKTFKCSISFISLLLNINNHLFSNAK